MTLLNTREVQKRLGNVSRPTLWRLRKRGNFPAAIAVTPGRVAFREDEITEYIQKCPRRDLADGTGDRQ
ncbi:MAG: helix-turn-helix domain-containing protein [Candidatus Hydrogenedentes bacterium]|nr:helix-turn-helix domain-containing protein [Candidatus Hydrogenedentota bacterium]